MKNMITERADRVLVKVDAFVADTVHVEVPNREVDLSPMEARRLAKLLRRSASAAEAKAELDDIDETQKVMAF